MTKKNFPKKGLIIGTSCLAVLGLAYVAPAIFFRSHFLPNTYINGVQAAGKTADTLTQELRNKLNDYQMVVKGEDGSQIKTISASEIDMNSDVKVADVQALLAKQPSFLWPSYLFGKHEDESAAALRYDNQKLKELWSAIPQLSDPNVLKTKDATVDYDPSSQSFVIQDEIYGKNVDQEKFQKDIERKIEDLSTEISLGDYYIKPHLLATDPHLMSTRDQLNQTANTKISYQVNGKTETVPREAITSWLGVDEQGNMNMDERAIASYVSQLASKYNTAGKPRDFQTSYGKTIRVSGGDFGKRVDQSAELSQLKKDLTAGGTINRDLIFTKNDADAEIGNSYVEVNLTAQHLYVYKNGQKVVDTAVTTGKPVNNHQTNPGLFRVKSRESNRTLRGFNDDGSRYASPVSYWMPFDGGIGLHDAPWKSNYGGKNYLTNGSHGCVNIPPSVAGQVYANVSVGTPVVVYNLPGTESSCTNRKVQNAINKIAAAGSNAQAAKTASEAYEALSGAEKRDVYNVSVLKNALDKYKAELSAPKVEEHKDEVNTDHE